jgi:hypothetical protein
MTDKKSKIFFGLFSFLVMLSLVVTFYKYVIIKDFEILTDEEAFHESLLDQ